MSLPTGPEFEKPKQRLSKTALRNGCIIAGRRALLSKLLETGFATCDDVRRVVRIPTSVHPSCMGGVPLPLVEDSVIEQIAWIRSERPVAHRRPISVWRLIDRDAADAILRNLPVTEIPHEVDPLPDSLKQKSLFDDDEGGPHE